jgi:hypothetical protein
MLLLLHLLLPCEQPPGAVGELRMPESSWQIELRLKISWTLQWQAVDMHRSNKHQEVK